MYVCVPMHAIHVCCAITVLAPAHMVSLLTVVGLLCVALPSGSSSPRHLSMVETRSSQMLRSGASSCKSHVV